MDPQLIINGIALGSIIALGAVGLTLTYGILRLSNFAHGDYMTLGAFVAWTLNVSKIPFLSNIWVSMIIGIIATVGVALLAEAVLWKRMRRVRATATTLVIISIGLALFLRNGILLIYGGDAKGYNLPVSEAIDLFGLKIKFYNLVVLGLAILAIAGLHFLLQNTKIGKAMRAVADDVDLARVTGINVERVVLWTWIISASLTGLGGQMYGLVTNVRPDMGWFLIMPMFAAVTLGGIGNPYGAIAGAFIIGIAQEVSVPFVGSQYKLAIALILMVLTLLFRPQGLFKGTA
ncbi:branched-chain amino acid ABC transporter permease [Chamaesiphon sp. OTE_75_metabat_556]|uniref:branched-chain amino acid ABC transporter permease n=1 Tax=Chamaesiphon sp. OTE_75_metabat_556 TaxID=2964692 RepID=UPI00286BF856|nr:branched-chain amino acid ABC transporter permease [Chamaesiphon sp. OTE_75_metabat_556]